MARYGSKWVQLKICGIPDAMARQVALTLAYLQSRDCEALMCDRNRKAVCRVVKRHYHYSDCYSLCNNFSAIV